METSVPEKDGLKGTRFILWVKQLEKKLDEIHKDNSF